MKSKYKDRLIKQAAKQAKLDKSWAQAKAAGRVWGECPKAS